MAGHISIPVTSVASPGSLLGSTVVAGHVPIPVTAVASHGSLPGSIAVAGHVLIPVTAVASHGSLPGSIAVAGHVPIPVTMAGHYTSPSLSTMAGYGHYIMPGYGPGLSGLSVSGILVHYCHIPSHSFPSYLSTPPDVS